MTKGFWKAAFVRAIRTLCQTALALIGTSALMQQVNWLELISASCLAAIVSLITSVATGLPEAPKDTKTTEDKGA